MATATSWASASLATLLGALRIGDAGFRSRSRAVPCRAAPQRDIDPDSLEVLARGAPCADPVPSLSSSNETCSGWWMSPTQWPSNLSATSFSSLVVSGDAKRAKSPSIAITTHLAAWRRPRTEARAPRRDALGEGLTLPAPETAACTASAPRGSMSRGARSGVSVRAAQRAFFSYVPTSSARARTCPCIASSSRALLGRPRSRRTVSRAKSLWK
jgi:hypothetical protein